jgi:hypothetical protein
MIGPVIVVTGLPGSGKTTLARQLSASLGLPLLSLDSVKEALVDHVDCDDRIAIRAAARNVIARIVPDCPRGCIMDSMRRGSSKSSARCQWSLPSSGMPTGPGTRLICRPIRARSTGSGRRHR